METKTCENCNVKIIGRSDKRFCSPECRNESNNKKNSDVNKFVRNVNNTLRKNRRILESLNPKGKTVISRDKMVAKGFNFNYFTNIYHTKTNRTYYFCYEHGYFVDKEKNECLLVVRQDYMKA